MTIIILSGVVCLVEEGKEKYGWEAKRIKAGDTKSWVGVIEEGYDLVWLEGVTNPMLDVCFIFFLLLVLLFLLFFLFSFSYFSFLPQKKGY